MTHDRLSAQDTTFLHIEHARQPQHVGSLGIFEGEPFFDDIGRFRLDDARRLIASRLPHVPRFRRRLMTVAFQQGRPIWVDDDEFDLAYHVRHTALPRPGSDEQLHALMGRLQSQLLDRRRPLWELWFVEGLAGGRVAIIQKTHHALVDGVAGVDVATVLLDLEPDVGEPVVEPWQPDAAPSRAQLLADSLVERVTQPAEVVRSVRSATRAPRQAIRTVASLGRAVSAVSTAAPEMPWNVPVSAHRRWESTSVDLATVRAIKDAAGATVNDVVLAVCAGALRSFLEHRSVPVDGLTLRALVPVSVRDDSERHALGNRVSGLPADIPVGEPDARTRLELVHENMRHLKESGMAVGGDVLISLQDYAPPTLVNLASRLVVRSRAVNLGITNVPGPQVPLYCMGAKMLEAYPYVGIVRNQALMIALVSYDGRLGFGITGDRDVLPDLAVLTEGIEKAVVELVDAVG